jgi:ABC-type nitrate/sulfonate/bicarbonate transport system permease component
LIVKDGTRPLVKLYLPICPLAMLPLTIAAFPIKPEVIDPELIVKLDKRPLATLPD